jgi:hypothetical protein
MEEILSLVDEKTYVTSNASKVSSTLKAEATGLSETLIHV